MSIPPWKRDAIQRGGARRDYDREKCEKAKTLVERFWRAFNEKLSPEEQEKLFELMRHKFKDIGGK